MSPSPLFTFASSRVAQEQVHRRKWVVWRSTQLYPDRRKSLSSDTKPSQVYVPHIATVIHEQNAAVAAGAGIAGAKHINLESMMVSNPMSVRAPLCLSPPAPADVSARTCSRTIAGRCSSGATTRISIMRRCARRRTRGCRRASRACRWRTCLVRGNSARRRLRCAMRCIRIGSLDGVWRM